MQTKPQQIPTPPSFTEAELKSLSLCIGAAQALAYMFGDTNDPAVSSETARLRQTAQNASDALRRVVGTKYDKVLNQMTPPPTHETQ